MSEEKKIVTVDDLKETYPELCKALAQQGTEIVTIDQLQQAYPDLCTQLASDTMSNSQNKEQIVAFVETLDIAEAKAMFPSLCSKLASPVGTTIDPKKGFCLDHDDPYGNGVARFFAKKADCGIPRIPCMLPYGKPATIEAMVSYIDRAGSAGDQVRCQAAIKILASVWDKHGKKCSKATVDRVTKILDHWKKQKK